MINPDPNQLHNLKFTTAAWAELIDMSFEPFEFCEGEPMRQGQWMALADMAAGKAYHIDLGWYDDEKPSHSSSWANDLRRLASQIMSHFYYVTKGIKEPTDGGKEGHPDRNT